jgi:glycosyltransferase involved in cell wall biosynthesis
MQHPVGGIRTYIKYVYGRLPRDKYGFTILTTETSELELTSSDFRSHEVAFFKAPAGQGLTSLLPLVFRAVASGKYHILHSHGYTAGAATALANLAFGLPHIVTPHHVLQAADFPAPWGAAKRRLVSSLIGRADIIQCVGHEAQRNLVSSLPGLDRRCETIVIANGIDVDLFDRCAASQQSSWRKQLDLLPGTFLFGFLGRMMPEKGFEYLADAVRILVTEQSAVRPFEVAVLSDGGFIREQRARVQRAGLSRYFHFVGFVPDVASVLAGLDAVVMPSLWEACSLLAMEALVSGCPLVASRCAGIRELIQGSPAVGVPPADAPALARAMLSVMNDHDAVKQATLAFVPVARARFDARAGAAELDAVLDRLLATRQTGGHRSRQFPQCTHRDVPPS